MVLVVIVPYIKIISCLLLLVTAAVDCTALSVMGSDMKREENRLYYIACTAGSVQSSSSYIFRGVGPLVDPFRSHVSRRLFKGPPGFLLPVGE